MGIRICRLCIEEGRILEAMLGPTDEHAIAHLRTVHGLDARQSLLPEQRCPVCRVQQRPIAAQPAGQVKGDDLNVMACGKCGTFLVIEKTGPRVMTLEEVAGLPDEARIMLQRFRRLAEAGE